MWVFAVGLVLLLMVFGIVVLSLAAYVRAEDARATLRLVNKRLLAIEKHLGLAGPEPAAARPAGARARSAAGNSLEEKIALIWLARIGAGILLAGAVFFLLAPAGGGLSRSGRVVAGVLFGVAALAFAEANRKRARPLFNQVVLGIGVAVLLVSALAGHRLYGIASAAFAFAAALATCALGAFLALRHRAEIALLLAVAGGLLAPPLLWPGAPPAGLLAYLLLLSWAGAAVALRGVFPWALWLSLLGPAGLAAGWALRAWDLGPGGAFHPLPARAAPVLFAVLFVAGWTLAHRRARAPCRERLKPLALLVTLLLAGHGLFAVFLRDQPVLLGLSFAALALLGSRLLGREMKGELLAVPAAAGFLVLLGSVRPDSPGAQTLAALAAWGGIHAVALLRPGRAALALSGAAGTAFLILAGELLAPHRPRWFAAVVTLWSLGYAFLAMTRRSPLLLAATGLVAFLGLAGAGAPLAKQGDLGLAFLYAAWALVYVGGLGFRVLVRRETPEVWHVAAASGAGAALALLVLLVTPPQEALARAAFFAGVAAAHLLLGLALLARAPAAGTWLMAGAVAFLALAATFPLPGWAATFAWAALATGLVAAGFARASRRVRSLGLGLFAATVLKVALWDLWTLGRAWQVFVLLGVGALLLLASYFYARRGGRVRDVLGERGEPAAPQETGGGD